MKKITNASEGFVYLESVNGVTGPRATVNPRVRDLLKEIKHVRTNNNKIHPFCQRSCQNYRPAYTHACLYICSNGFPYCLQVTDKAVVVGFGISTPDHVRQIS
uniref:tryptophan synthase n=1 Tax=Triticum urartu TaxID=4572 RepID=A0A8R7QGR5_TRIUA